MLFYQTLKVFAIYTDFKTRWKISYILNASLFFLSLQRCTPNPIAHGSKKSGKCVVTIGTATFYTQYYIRVWARNEVGNGPIPEPVIGLSAVKGMSSIIYYCVCYVFNHLLQAIYTGISTGLFPFYIFHAR